MSTPESKGSRPIPGYPGYEADADGRIISTSGWRGLPRRILVPFPDEDGYQRVRVIDESRRRISRPVHILVLLAFHGPRTGPHARHLDGNSQNNSASNLKWGTAKENVADQLAHGRHGARKLTQEQVEEIRRELAAGARPTDLARRFPVTAEHIGQLKHDLYWKAAL